ncbi:hypothetical protein R1flu_012454 [Riccia fluitans]|uniref:Uncharacterized protein n=1 Tax=Riccia fluitans TaxID=41844 RepID=A0ABD1ZET1_9MARC
MAGGQAKKIWETLLSPFEQVDKRQLQHEIDPFAMLDVLVTELVQHLNQMLFSVFIYHWCNDSFLLTSYNRLRGSGGKEVAKEVQASADSKPFTTSRDWTVKMSNLDRVEVAEKFYEHFGHSADVRRGLTYEWGLTYESWVISGSDGGATSMRFIRHSCHQIHERLEMKGSGRGSQTVVQKLDVPIEGDCFRSRKGGQKMMRMAARHDIRRRELIIAGVSTKIVKHFGRYSRIIPIQHFRLIDVGYMHNS